MKKVKKSLISVLIITLVMTFSFSMPGMAFADETQDSVRFGTAEEYSTYEAGAIMEDAFYYDDSWFDQAPAERNDALALVSMQLVASAIENDKDERCVDFLEKLGFENIKSKSLGEGNDGLGYTIGMKKAGSDTLAAIVVHSYAFDKPSKETAWLQNFTINGEDQTSGEQYSYQKAVAQFDTAALRKEIEDYASGSGGKLKFWIMGQSRGGALANLTAIKLKGQAEADDVYAYTFEAPAVVDADLVDSAKDYSYIHNYITEDDIVTMVPPWGMVRYGSDYGLKAELADKGVTYEDINRILEMLGSSAVLEGENALEGVDPKELIKLLENRTESRVGYTQKRTDTFKTLEGEELSLEYDYQAVFRDLMSALFGETGIYTEGIADYLMEFIACFESAVRGYMTETGELPDKGISAEAYYWDTTVKAYELLDSLDGEEGNLPLSKEDVYVMLKLIAPAAIDTSMLDDLGYEITDDPMDTDAIMICLAPALDIGMNASALTISHNFDVVIARLKALTSYPDAGDIAIEIPAPASGDSASKVSGQVANAAEDLGISWLSASAKWDTEDKTLRKNKVYYLNAEFEVIGHNIPETINVTINGEKPIAAPKVTFKDGISLISGTWKIAIGTPGECTITFDSDFHGEAPEPMVVPYGEKLKYVDYPVMEDQEGLRFNGWQYNYEDPWDTLTVTKDIEVDAHWIDVVDEVELKFEIPVVGQSAWKLPSIMDNYPPYKLGDLSLYDEHYDQVDKIPAGELNLSFNVYPEYNAEFKVSFDEDGYGTYEGTLTINGEEIDADYDNEGKYLRVDYYFEAKPAPQKGDDGTAVGKGASLSVADSFHKNWLSNKDPKGTKFAPLKLRSGKQTKTSVTLNWNKNSKAKNYIVYGNLSGSENKLKKLKTVTGSSTTVKKAGKSLKSGKYYKFIVMAVDKNNKVVSTSKMIHVATKGTNKATNYKALKVKVKKAGGKYKTVKSVTLKKGKTAQIKATQVKTSTKAKVRSILGARYESSNTKVATVTTAGKIKATGKGTCTVYIYTQNGLSKTVKVIVK